MEKKRVVFRTRLSKDKYLPQIFFLEQRIERWGPPYLTSLAIILSLFVDAEVAGVLLKYHLWLIIETYKWGMQPVQL